MQIHYRRALSQAQHEMLPQSSLNGCIFSTPTYKLNESMLMLWKHWVEVVRRCL